MCLQLVTFTYQILNLKTLKPNIPLEFTLK